VHHWIETVSQGVGGVAWLVPVVLNGIVGIVAGAVVLAVVSAVGKLWNAARA